jgi:Fe-S oxidoreductase
MSERRSLAVLDERRAELENCNFCPKLCRAACPISDAESNESVTPWGKMSSTLLVADGREPRTAEYGELPWACTGCFACRERCEQRNLVAETLFDARADYVAVGIAPRAAERVHTGFPARLRRIDAAIERLRAEEEHSATAPTALLVGCEYVLHFPEVARDAVRAARRLFGPVRVLNGCCGYPLRAAGYPQEEQELRAGIERQAKGARRLVAVDAGCAFTLGPEKAMPLARAALAALGERRTSGASEPAEPLRYHDPCLLGRGLGEYDAPRELIARRTGRAPLEFLENRRLGRCSGGGGLLPLTRPATAARIARDRVEQHERLGGGKIVTACAQSLRRLRQAGADVIDLTAILRELSEL